MIPLPLHPHTKNVDGTHWKERLILLVTGTGFCCCFFLAFISPKIGKSPLCPPQCTGLSSPLPYSALSLCSLLPWEPTSCLWQALSFICGLCSHLARMSALSGFCRSSRNRSCFYFSDFCFYFNPIFDSPPPTSQQ